MMDDPGLDYDSEDLRAIFASGDSDNSSSRTASRKNSKPSPQPQPRKASRVPSIGNSPASGSAFDLSKIWE